MKKYAFLLAALAALASARAPVSAEEVRNLVSNGGFEQSANGKTPDGWTAWAAGTTGEILLDKTVAHTGTASIKLTGHDKKSFASLVAGGDNLFKPGKSYLVTFWCRGSNLNPTSTSGFVTLMFDPRKADGAYLGTIGASAPDSIYRRESSDWQMVRKVLTIPSNPDIAKVYLKLALSATEGSVWFDDLEITEVE